MGRMDNQISNYRKGGSVMHIQSISTQTKGAVVELSADELVRLCNVLYVQDRYKDNLHYKLYGDMMIARDLCQYGHIDGFCFDRIAECRSKLQTNK